MRMLIMGPPGAGKGTQAKLIVDRYQVPAISTDDIFRAMQHTETPLAREVRAVMESGGYVSDELTDATVEDRLTQPDCADGFLLDGYPRTPHQVTALTELLARTGHIVDAVVSLTAETEELVTRLLSRARAEHRLDDTEAIIRRRQHIYTDQTAPLIELYRQWGVVLEVDGSAPVAAVQAQINAGLDHRQRPSTPVASYGK